METVLAVACVCLLLIILIIFLRLAHFRRELRSFSEELEKWKNEDYAQPIKVTTFDKNIVRLAVVLTEHAERLRKIGEEYSAAKKQLGNVISGISHDFRTPLTAALGYLQMLEKSSALTGQEREYLGIAIQKNRYLKDLSDEFFEVTRSESGEELYIETVNLSNVITELLLEQNDWIEERGITAEFDIQDGVETETDRHYIERITENLMSNARKYSVSRLSASLHSDHGKIVLRVSNDLSDAGSVDISRVFEPFYRMENRTGNGTGLGLYVVKRLADKLGYEVSAQLEDECFMICLTIDKNA